MVNYSTNINKTKESLNSDGQQFHQYQQNEQSPHWTQKSPQDMTLEIQVLAWERQG
jgi:hypothetical protein